MNHRSNYIGAVLVVLIVTFRYAGIGSALGQNTGITNQAENETDIFHNSALRNASLENCDNLEATNISAVGENLTSNATEDPTNKLSSPYLKDMGPSVILAPFVMCLGVWSVVANSLLLAAIIKREPLHKPGYILMANLAASDVLNGVVFFFAAIFGLYLANAASLPSPTIFRLRFTCVFLSGLSSAYSLMALTAERYWFIVHGMTYINNVTNDKCKVVIVIVWVWSALLAMLPMFGWNCAGSFEDGCLPIGGGLPYSYVVVFLMSVFIPIAAIILLNIGVFSCLWKYVNAICGQAAAVGAPPTASRKSLITMVIITVVFLVGWLPIFIQMALLPGDFMSVAKKCIFIILNSAINPVIYGFRLEEVRRGVARLFVNNNGDANFRVIWSKRNDNVAIRGIVSPAPTKDEQ